MDEKKIKLEDVPHISVKKLASKIKAVDRQTISLKGQAAVTARKPQFALFLGAGASVESGIITAGQMIKIFKDEIFGNDCGELETDGEKEDWLKKQGWYKSGKDEYGCLFEQFADTRTERQRFIEIICDRNPLTKKEVEPSFGYVVLADLLLRNYINTVVTTNFDDLVYIAATTFTGIRPIVYAYGILASEMKMTAPHAKVLKLHGDYLYSNIVNTSDEMRVQSNAVAGDTADSREVISNLNMERQVRTVLDNFGLIVVGYSGGDVTVMKLLEQVSENNGFYWCYRKDSPPDADVLKLVKSKNGKLVEIGGFDDLMKEISDRTEFSIEDLLQSFERRKENLIERITEFNESYRKKPLNQYAGELVEKQKDKTSDNLSAGEYFVLGYRAGNENNYPLAEEYYRKSIELNPDYADAYNNLGILIKKDEKRFDEAETNYRKAIELNPNYAVAYSNLGVLLAEDENRREEAEQAYNKAIELNPTLAEAYSNLGILLAKDENRREEAEQAYNKAIELNPNYANAYSNLGVLLAKDENRTEEAEQAYNKAIELNPTLAEAYSNLGNLLAEDENRREEAEQAYNKAIELNPTLANAYYNFACLDSLRNNRDSSFDYLRKAVEMDSKYKSMSKTDSDFDNVRDDERFWEIVGRDDE